jgi:hypothetical protein
VEALRSGEYKQGEGYLHRGDRFCCLGVACVLALRDGVAMETAEQAGIVLFGGSDGVAPSAVMAWLGLQNERGAHEGSVERVTLTSLNDIGYSFAEIADLIESEPEGLFA